MLDPHPSMKRFVEFGKRTQAVQIGCYNIETDTFVYFPYVGVEPDDISVLEKYFVIKDRLDRTEQVTSEANKRIAELQVKENKDAH